MRGRVVAFVGLLLAFGFSGCISGAAPAPPPEGEDERPPEVVAPSPRPAKCEEVVIYRWHGQLTGVIDYDEAFNATGEHALEVKWLVTLDGRRAHTGLTLRLADEDGYRIEKIDHGPELDASGSTGRSYEYFIHNMTEGVYRFQVEGIGHVEHLDSEFIGTTCK